MGERKPVKPSSNLTRMPSTPAPSPPPTKKPDNNRIVAIAGAIGLLVVIGKCSSSSTGGSSETTETAEEVGNAQQALVTAVAAQSPPPIRALSSKDVRSGASRVDLASREGLAGELIYSQNCYDALGSDFSWRKLDECGGFDVEASLALGEYAPAGSEREVAWFDGEAAAGRYLKAATAAGQEAAAADGRLAALQTQVGRRHTPAPGSNASPKDNLSNDVAGEQNPSDREKLGVEDADFAIG